MALTSWPSHGSRHLGFAFTLAHVPDWAAARRVTASLCLRGASLLLPGGFFLGGLFTHGGDPGLGILLVPVGATILFVAIFLTAASARSASPGPDSTTGAHRTER